MASEIWCWASSTAGLMVLFSIVVSTDTTSSVCTHGKSTELVKSPAPQLIKSAILSSLRDVVRDRRGRQSPHLMRHNELDNLELAVFQKMFDKMSEQDQKERPQRCGRRCRRRRHHNRRRKNVTSANANMLAPYKPSSGGPDLLKSNKAAVVITKASHILRQDWCKTEPLKQQIHLPGCRPKTIVNNFCYGQCNSFFIPSSDDTSNVTSSAFKSCAVCKPRLTSWSIVTLRCPGMIPPTRTKRIMRVHKCRCQSEVAR